MPLSCLEQELDPGVDAGFPPSRRPLRRAKSEQIMRQQN